MGVSLSILVSGCAKKPAAIAPSVAKSKPSINFTLDDCEHYGNLKKAVVKLIVEKEQMRAIRLKEESGKLASIDNKIKELKAEIEKLKKANSSDVATVSEISKKVKISSSCVGEKPRSYYIHLEPDDIYFPSKRVNIRICPYPKSKIIGHIEKNQKVRFKTCNRFGWCELKDQDGYVVGNLFTSKKTHKKVY